MFNPKRFFTLLIRAIILFVIVSQFYIIYLINQDCDKWFDKWKYTNSENKELAEWNSELIAKNKFLGQANKELAAGIGALWIENGSLSDELKRVKKNRQLKVEKKYEY